MFGMTSRTKLPDYYQDLGIPRSATSSEIKAAYRTLALRWHPDKNPHNLTEANVRFQVIAQAYAVLSDLEGRRKYDTRNQRNGSQSYFLKVYARHGHDFYARPKKGFKGRSAKCHRQANFSANNGEMNDKGMENVEKVKKKEQNTKSKEEKMKSGRRTHKKAGDC